VQIGALFILWLGLGRLRMAIVIPKLVIELATHGSGAYQFVESAICEVKRVGQVTLSWES